MRRTFLAGLAAFGLGVSLLGGPAVAVVPASSSFEWAVVIGEDGAPPPGTFGFDATLVSGTHEFVAGASVVMLARTDGSSTYQPAAQGTTDANGHVSVSVTLSRTTTLRWSYAGDSTHEATTSGPFEQDVAPRISVRAIDRSLARHQKVIVVGTSSPLKPGNRVSLWRGTRPSFASDQSMTRIATAVVRPDGTFRLTARFAHPGSKRLFVKINRGHANAEGYSRYLRIRVR